MVAVAADHRLQLAEVLLADAEDAGLVDDEDPQPVTGLQHLGRRRVVRRPVGVAAQLAELLQPPHLQPVGHGRADAGVVRVAADALELQRFAVELHAGGGVEGDVPHAEADLIRVDHAAADPQPRRDAVAVPVVRPPRARRIDHHLLPRRRGLAGRQRHRRPDHGDQLAAGTADRVLHLGLDATVRGVGDLRRQRDAGRLAGRPVDRGEHAVGHEVDGVGDGEPGVPVDAAALVEPALLLGGIDADGDGVAVGVVEVEHVAHVHLQRQVARAVKGKRVAVDEDRRVAVDPVEAERHPLARPRRVDAERPVVPADAHREEAVAQRERRVGRPLHRPVVRQVDRPPGGRVEARRRRAVALAGLAPHHAVGLAQLGLEAQQAPLLVAPRDRPRGIGVVEAEAPGGVEAEALAGRKGHGSGILNVKTGGVKRNRPQPRRRSVTNGSCRRPHDPRTPPRPPG